MGNIMIMTASTGGGHNQVAMTLEEAFKERGHDVLRVDFIKEENKILEMIVEDGYELLASRFPKLYGELYRITNRAAFNGPFVKLFIRAERRRTWEIIREKKPDLIVGTHPFAVKLVGSLKEKGRIRAPFISIVTDFEAHQAYIDPAVEAYVTGSRHTRAGLIKKGILPERIHPFGIPVKAEFLQSAKPPDVHDDVFTILLMGGSMGMKGIKKVLAKLMAMEEPLFVYAVCGNNRELKTRLREKHADAIAKGRLAVLGFVDNIWTLMDDADVIITKPGGLTVSESIAKRLPMIIPFFIPGQEEENADFMALRSAAVKLEHAGEVQAVVRSLMRDPERLKAMRHSMEAMGRGDALESITALSERLLEDTREAERLKVLLEGEIARSGIRSVWSALHSEGGTSVMARRLEAADGAAVDAVLLEKVFIDHFYHEDAFKRDDPQ